MGIGGLLPLLKPIQVQQHLSDFSGKTVAVDAYVWLHRGIFTCAVELATGKPTTRYVEYVMQKVRLLRHHNVAPYFVFDGGPLAAKRGTEGERKSRRAENKAKGDALTRQGRHKEAREYYCKCIDVTPQMAFQVIKALRAENVEYVVAPYEADAQLAFLEREGIVQGIISEDSDLLVFGCRRMLYKFDATTATFTYIARDNLGAVPCLRGWSDAQFRAMAVLAGGDYLPSVQGVGIKTANALVRKHRSLEGAVRALRLDGKYNVPKGYLQSARRVERVYIHQRVFDPIQRRLVHLAPIEDGLDWTDADEALVGEDMDPKLACAIACGDACPVTRVPMVDINPSYSPRRVHPLVLDTRNASASRADKGKKKATMLDFFAPSKSVTKPPGSPRKSRLIAETAHVARKVVAGRASGKRTLADAHEMDTVTKRHKYGHALSAPSSPSRSERNQNVAPEQPKPSFVESRFFGKGTGLSRRHSMPVSRLGQNKPDGEVIEIVDEEDNEEDIADADMDVLQEDGYLSPGPSLARCTTPDLSSPARHQQSSDAEDDILSSPDRGASPRSRERSASPLAKRGAAATSLLSERDPNSTQAGDDKAEDSDKMLRGPVLFAASNSGSGSEAEDVDVDEPQPSFGSTGTVTPSPPTQRQREKSREEPVVIDLLDELEDIEEVGARARHAAVANGWWTKFSAAGRIERNEGCKVDKLSPHGLRRNETTATPASLRGARSRNIRKSLVLSETRTRTAQVQDVTPRLPALFDKLRYQGSSED